MPKLIIDGKETEVEDGLTVMQACQQAGIEIPHFCFHERLNIAGNCRMCLVEVEKSPKPVASCAMPVSDGMVVHTTSTKVQKAREGVMEFLLINHPLDCPICDQAGECDLQDQAFKYGKGKSRYTEHKRSVQEKNLGPLVKTEMIRCIHCTRCIRFTAEVAGIEEMGTTGRGEHMEIVSYLEKNLTSELSGNIIDLCPVGALTSKPYAFKARSWELTSTESIDVMDAMGSSIRIDTRDLEVMRILPKLNEDINEEWISDKARFSYDGLKNARLDRPYIKKNGRFEETSWEKAIKTIADRFANMKDKSKIGAIAGTLAPCETMFLLKKLLASFGSDFVDANQSGYKLDRSGRANYLFGTTIAGIEKADICLLVGANTRQVAPVLGARIGKMVRRGSLKTYRIGTPDNQTYKITELGDRLEVLEHLLTNKIKNDPPLPCILDFKKALTNARNPMIIIGDAALIRPDGYGIISLLHQITDKYRIVRPNWNGFNILHNHASMVGALDLDFIYGNSGTGSFDILHKTQAGEIEMLYLLGSDDIDMSKIGESCFVIYQGHHGDAGAGRADVILPEAAYTEQDGMYINLEGRLQLTRKAVHAPGVAKAGVEIISMIAEGLVRDGSFSSMSLQEIRAEMSRKHQIFSHVDEILPSEFVPFKSNVKIAKKSLEKLAMNYYMTDPISRASVTMAKCSSVLNTRNS